MRAEAWHPRVGDRVRVRDRVGRAIDCAELPHSPAEAGHVGKVANDRPRASFPGHPYLVVFDKPVPLLVIGSFMVPLHVRHYATDELEPTDA